MYVRVNQCGNGTVKTKRKHGITNNHSNVFNFSFKLHFSQQDMNLDAQKTPANHHNMSKAQQNA